ncbi:MAG TPA: DNA translocase FtsK 4TM domain-containing protein, partial [Bryobacteraceae bacterium]
MKFLGPTRFHRLNEALAFVFLFAGLFFVLTFVSYHPQDPSWNSAAGIARAHNLTGSAGAYTADFFFQLLGLAALSIPLLLWMLAWRWVRSEEIKSPGIKILGSLLLFLSICTALSIGPEWRPLGGAFSAGGVLGLLLADSLMASLNLTGAVLVTAICLILSVYLISTFSMATAGEWIAGPLRFLRNLHARWDRWRAQRRQVALERAAVRAEKRAAKESKRSKRSEPRVPIVDAPQPEPPRTQPAVPREEEIPIHTLEYDIAPPEPMAPVEVPAPLPVLTRQRKPLAPEVTEHPEYRLPSTDLLNEIPGRNPYDSIELKEIAGRIKAKFEEFNVHGSVVQINPGPVVTTFEFKPEAGIKYSRIITLTEDLCLGLQAESI